MSEVAKEMLDNKEELEEQIKELFQKIDTDHSNEIDKIEFRTFVRKLYQKKGKKINDNVIDKFIKNLDTDKNGTLSLDEFRNYAITLLTALSKGNK